MTAIVPCVCVCVCFECSQYPLMSVDTASGGYQTQNCEERSHVLLFVNAEGAKWLNSVTGFVGFS